ncbi:MAG: hypothetical protein Q9219_002230 [cf. Caloplaca sp. 3 TL-2023]
MRPLIIKLPSLERSPQLRLILRQTSIASKWRHQSSLAGLKEEMISRKLPTTFDTTSPTPSLLLDTTLRGTEDIDVRRVITDWTIPPGHHLVYLPPLTPLSSLCSDGTDPLHSPGAPFTRRLWAGGDIDFQSQSLRTHCRLRCDESITDVQIKGRQGGEKIYVNIERQVWLEGRTAATLKLTENRKLVFLREQSNPIRDPIKSPYEAEASYTLTPSPSLLFRFSALTFNAHRIHLDLAYCRETEGHRNLVVHGPLSLVLMLQLVRDHLRSRPGQRERISRIEYRCLAPLYAEEEMTVCLRRKASNLYDVWIEGPDGGLAVKGTVTTISTTQGNGDDGNKSFFSLAPEESDSNANSERSPDRDESSRVEANGVNR